MPHADDPLVEDVGFDAPAATLADGRQRQAHRCLFEHGDGRFRQLILSRDDGFQQLGQQREVTVVEMADQLPGVGDISLVVHVIRRRMVLGHLRHLSCTSL